MGVAIDKGKTGKMTERQRRFVEEYLVDLNGTQAAIRAGFSDKGADVAANRLLGNMRVQSALAEAKRMRTRRSEITAARVLEEIAYIAFSDLRDAFEQVGDTLVLRKLSEMPEGVRRSIESIREQPTDKGVLRSVKLHSKMAALKMLAEHLGLEAPKRHELTGQDGKPIAVKGVNSLTREQTIQITSRILGVAQSMVEKKFIGSGADVEAKDE